MLPIHSDAYLRVRTRLRNAAKALKNQEVIERFQEYLTARANLVSFNLDDVADPKFLRKLIKTAPTTPGLYYFEADLSEFARNCDDPVVPAFKNAWDQLNAGLSEKEQFSTPTHLDLALARHLGGENLDRVPFYVGREHSVRKRLGQHIRGVSGRGTSSLRLLQRRKALTGISFRVSWLRVLEKTEADEYLIVTLLEHALQTKMQPILGKQRIG